MEKLQIKMTAQELAERLRNNPKEAPNVIKLCGSLNLTYRDFVLADARTEDLNMLVGVV